jgi:hypothetical protein
VTTEESFLGRHAFRNSAAVCPPEGVTDPNERNNVAIDPATIKRPSVSAIDVSQDGSPPARG